ncbi:chemotaxis protein CheW [Coleofasciculus sp. FACHB-129]|uniref:chemotaxis protein CheW n=1 Tax=Cyanophyceae TaxID=3028117 RepID=UPI0016874A85|nr:chemotaxis protein CheW [Coleofasciculus sp. FACHB-129]MBD1894133.1 chemotaxis protein CheW [Coleofasciculus sp. FACHB-129]
MNSTLINSTPPDFDRLDVSASVPAIKVLVFSIGSLNLGLRIESIYKVLNSTQIFGSGLNGVGIAHVGDREVTVLNLQQRLFSSNSTHETLQGAYLIVLQNTESELYGIPVETVPALIDVPLSTIRVLPESFRHANTLGIASHVAVISQPETSLTLFLLDIDTTTKLSGGNFALPPATDEETRQHQ